MEVKMEENYSELVDRLKKGNMQAAEEIYHMTSKKAFYTAYYMLGTKNMHDAQDIVQESYMYAFMNIAQLRDNDKFESWLNKIVINKTKDYFVKNNGRIFVSAEDENAELWNEVRYADTSFQEYQDNSDRSQIIFSILDKLPDEQRICIIMYYYNQMSVSEISVILDIPEGTVKSRLYKAREEIKKYVEKQEENGIKLYMAGIGATIFIALNSNNINVQAAENIVLQNIKKCFNAASNAGNSIAGTGGTVMKNNSLPLWTKISLVAGGLAVIAGIIAVIVLNTGNGDNKNDNKNKLTNDISSQYVEEDNDETDDYEDDTRTPLKKGAYTLKGLKAEKVNDNLLEQTGINSQDVENIYSSFLAKDIICVSVFFKNNTHKKFLITTDGEIINSATDYENVLSEEYVGQYPANWPGFTYPGYNNMFCISFNKDNTKFNTWGLMDSDGNMILNNEYTYIQLYSQTFAVAYKAQPKDSDEAPESRTFERIDNSRYDNWISNTGVMDVYNVKTGNKIDALSDIYMPLDYLFSANDEIICLELRQDKDDDGKDDIIVCDKDGNVLDYSYEEAIKIIEEKGRPWTKSESYIQNNEGSYYLINDDGKKVSKEYENIMPIEKVAMGEDNYIVQELEYINTDNNYYVTKSEDGQYGIIDKKGKVICDCVLQNVLSDFKNGVCLVVYKGELVYINQKGEIIEPYERENVQGNFMVLVKNEEEKYKEIITPGGTMELNSEKKFYAMSANKKIFTVGEETEDGKKIMLYDYALNKLLEISGKTESDADIYINMDSTYACVSDNNKNLVLYKITQ